MIRLAVFDIDRTLVSPDTGVIAPETVAAIKQLQKKGMKTAVASGRIYTFLQRELLELGFDFADSKTNFIFASHKTVPAKELFDALRAEGIIVRYFNKPRIDNYLRISIGTDEEMDTMLAFLTEYLKDK